MSAKDEARQKLEDYLRIHIKPCSVNIELKRDHLTECLDDGMEYADAYAAVAVAEARAPLVEALRAVEWVRHGCEYEKNSWCPACDTEEHYGHAPDCPLAAALAKETPDA
jgi:wobble nucleotide-excising tRNase